MRASILSTPADPVAGPAIECRLIEPERILQIIEDTRGVQRVHVRRHHLRHGANATS
jgi:hypothetical protein